MHSTLNYSLIFLLFVVFGCQDTTKRKHKLKDRKLSPIITIGGIEKQQFWDQLLTSSEFTTNEVQKLREIDQQTANEFLKIKGDRTKLSRDILTSHRQLRLTKTHEFLGDEKFQVYKNRCKEWKIKVRQENIANAKSKG